MINRLRARLQDPSKGWDPVSPDYAEKYSAHEWGKVDSGLIDRLGDAIGGFRGKRVLDIGAGPGQYAVSFAQRGATVTWHDISKTYQQIAQQRAGVLAASMEWSLGYLEDAAKLQPESFDLVFNRICWNYTMCDEAFAKLIWSLVKPGGIAYVDVNNSRFRTRRAGIVKLQTWVNDIFAVKAGHPYPPPGRVPGLFAALSPLRIDAQFVNPTSERIMVWKKTLDSAA